MNASLNPHKVRTLIELINESLVKNETYRINCYLSSAERVELEKRFEVKHDFDDFYVFKNKKNDNN
jgi:hypothetical protein